MLISGDLWSDYPIEKFLDFKLKKAAHLIFVREKKSKDAYLEAGIVKNSKTKNNLTYAGIAVINPKIFEGLNPTELDGESLCIVKLFCFSKLILIILLSRYS